MLSPFLDRRHGTESCIIEQIERLAFHFGWEIHLYSQHVDDVRVLSPSHFPVENKHHSIIWHRVPDIPGPHVLRYVWWLAANHALRWRDRVLGGLKGDVIYSPGINCLDADTIVVHIVFHEFVSRLSSELRLSQLPLKSWALILHRKVYYRLAMLLERRVYRDPHIRLIAVSPLVARQLKTHFDRTDVAIIPNAVDTLRFNPDARLSVRDSNRRSFGYSDEEFVLLLIGNDWKKKGLDTLLRALQLLKDVPVRLLVVGSDDPNLYKMRLDETGLRDRVRFEGRSSDVLSFYAAADLYVGPSLEDAFGLPILEAMACGLPVIASAQAGVSEFIHDGETGAVLSDPCDYGKLANEIQKLYSDASLQRRMSLAASAYVQKFFSWDQNALQTKEFLELTGQESADS